MTTGMADDRKNIVWIASYPKSGNTWVRFLVCNLVFGLQQSASALNELAPDVHELGTDVELPPTPCFMKTHFSFSPRLPFAAHTAAAIYVVRHPADVLVSNFHYSRRSGAVAKDSIKQDFDAYVERYLASRGDPRWLGLGVGAWADNIGSWILCEQQFPVLALRYEDLLGNCAAGAQQICAFLGINRTEREIQEASAGASFARMKEIEESDIRNRSLGIFYKPYLQESIGAGLRFMRSGKPGEGGQALSPQQQQRLATTFGPVMQQLGYAHEDTLPA